MASIQLFVPEDDIGEVDEVVVVTWLKREGDSVKEGEDLVIIQAEKVSVEIPAPASGVLTSILVPQGEVAKQGQPLAELEVSSVQASAAVEAVAEPTAATAAAVSTPARDVRASPIAKRLARQHGIDLSQVAGSGKEGRITEKDIQALLVKEVAPPASAPPPTPSAPAKDIRSSPIARRIAKEHQIDLADVPGAGERRLTEKDVRAFIESKQAQAYPATEPAPTPSNKSSDTIPLSGMRAAIAKRMHQSLQEMAQLTLHTEADVTELVALRTRLKEKHPITYTDLLVKASAKALQEHPHLNATLKDDTIHLLPEIHIGMAVALESGLIVPVIKNADQQSLADLARERARLIERATSNQLTSAEFSGGTFTITNLGTYDIDAFTPIVNPPEIAILGVGRIVEKVVIVEGKIAQRSMITLSLSFDHRLVDGAPAAAFLQSIKRHLEQPAGLE